MDTEQFQYKYFLFGAAMIPLLPFLFLQGQYTRLKVGRLPDAEGETSGITDGVGGVFRVLVIGESTVAGVGAPNHKEALSGQFAKHLSAMTGLKVEWNAVGKSGITVAETMKELVPKIPVADYNLILIALGGNDLFKVSSPRHWRENMTQLISTLRSENPDADVFLANIPMIRDFIAMPDPLRYCLSRLAKLQHFNTIRFTAELERVFYFAEVDRVDDEFFSDGIHPCSNGYDSWSKAMVESYLRKSSKISGT